MTHDDVVALLREASNPDPHVLLDDGEFSIHHNQNYPINEGNGFLHRICRVSLRNPGGYQIIGSYDQQLDGQWTCEISAPFDGVDDSTTSEPLGTFPTSFDAIAALWLERASAHFEP